MSEYLKEIAIGGLVILESLAILTNTDGMFFSLIIGAIAGVAGYTIGFERSREET